MIGIIIGGAAVVIAVSLYPLTAGLFPKICSTPFPGSSLYILPVSFPWLPFLSGILSCSPAFAYLPIPSLLSHLRDFITHDKFLQDILCFFYRIFSSTLVFLLVFHIGISWGLTPMLVDPNVGWAAGSR